MMNEKQLAALIKRLRSSGHMPPAELVDTILPHADLARPLLLEMATDAHLLNEDEPDCWAPLHALRMLGDIADPSIIDPLLQTVPIEWDGKEGPAFFWLLDLPQIIASCGAEAIPLLWQRFDDTNNSVAARTVAIEALGLCTALAPEARDELVARMRAVLASADDRSIISHTIRGLGYMSAREAYADVMQAYRDKRVDTAEVSAGEARQLLLSKRNPELDAVLMDFWERYMGDDLLYEEEFDE